MSDIVDEEAEWVRRALGIVIIGDPNDVEAAGIPTAIDAQWNKVRAGLELRIAAALKAGHAEATKIRALWSFAEEKAAAGDDLDAVQAGSRIEALLAGGAGVSPVPAGTVAFQRSRIMWIAAKQDMQNGLGTFRDAVVSLANDDEDKDDILAAVDTLVDEFSSFDRRLEDQLDAIAQLPDGAERQKLKAVARKTVDDYVRVLGSPFFSRIDNNPFAAVDVTGRGQACLSSISAALS